MKNEIVGILLAAGSSKRFGTNKLLHPLANGTPIGLASALYLRAATDRMLAVVRPDDTSLIDYFKQHNIEMLPCETATQGISASIACGIKASSDALAWIIGPADMPFVSKKTMVPLANALRQGASIVAPTFKGQRGQPTGFANTWFNALTKLKGDIGVESILDANLAKIELLPFEDGGVIWDINTLEDLSFQSLKR